MSNMSYCRFQNTLGDLRDCLEAMEDDPSGAALSAEEKKAMDSLIKVSNEITEGWNDEV